MTQLWKPEISARRDTELLKEAKCKNGVHSKDSELWRTVSYYKRNILQMDNV